MVNDKHIGIKEAIDTVYIQIKKKNYLIMYKTLKEVDKLLEFGPKNIESQYSYFMKSDKRSMFNMIRFGPSFLNLLTQRGQ